MNTYIIVYEYTIRFKTNLYLIVKNLKIWVDRIFISFCCLIMIHNNEIWFFFFLNNISNHNTNILFCISHLNHFFISFLYRCTKNSLTLFVLLSFYWIFVWKDDWLSLYSSIWMSFDSRITILNIFRLQDRSCFDSSILNLYRI